MTATLRRQRGTTLVIALIMLVVITLLAVSSLSTTNMNLKVVGNMQSRGEAMSAVQGGLGTHGTLMLIGHCIFAYQFFLIVKRAGPRRFAPALFREPAPMEGGISA